MRKALLTSSFLLIAGVLQLFGQVSVRLMLRNPMPSEISEWTSDPSVVQVVITNLGNDEYLKCKLGFTLTDDKGRVIARTITNSRYLPEFDILKPPFVGVFNGTQLINVNAVEYDKSIEKLAQRTNSIPEGNYQFCVSVYNQFGNNITQGGEYCVSIYTLMPEPPVLISPINDEELSGKYPVFRWMPVTSINTRVSQPRYKIKVCPVFQGQSPRMAIDMNPVLFEKTDITANFYQSMPGDLPFDFYPQVKQYVWMVQAFEPTGKPLGANQGRSELATFMLESSQQEYRIDNVYPVSGDTLPWLHPQMIVKIAPFESNITRVNYQLHVREEGSSTSYTYPAEVFYGPAQFALPLTPETSGYIVCNYRSGSIAPFMAALYHGKKYHWFVEATITRNDGTSATVRSMETSFVIGLRKPSKMEPKDEKSIIRNRAFELTFEIPQSEKLNFEHTLLFSIPQFNGFNAITQVDEKVRIEVSKNSSFETLTYSEDFKIPISGNYSTGSDCSGIYEPIRRSITPISDTGLYYWRIKYIDPLLEDAYFTSIPATFKIVPDSLNPCFEMLVEKPANNSNWTSGDKPTFAVLISPQIKKEYITGGRLRVWKMTSESQSIADARKEQPALDESFTGNAATKITSLSTTLDGYTRWELPFVNGDSDSKEFKADDNTYYTWYFRLNYNKDSIRADGCMCKTDSVISNNGIFQVKLSGDENPCPGDCFAEAPSDKTPGTQTLAKDSTLTIGKFQMKLESVTGTPASLSGEGSIEVPYLRAPIQVEFANIKVNSKNEVYEGDVFAKIDADAPYSKADANDFEGKVLDKLDGKLKAIHERSAMAGRLVSGFVNTSPIALPIGLDKDFNGYKTVVAIVAMKFTPTQAVLNAASWVELPSLGPDVGFGLGVKNVCFHKDGLGGTKRMELYLTKDFGYQSDDSWSFLFKSYTPSDSGTYAKWDCKGLHELYLKAEVEFPKTWLKKLDPADSLSHVKAYFKGKAEKNGNGWQWMFASVMDSCEFTQFEGFKLKVNEMIFDYSTSRNPEGISFPDGYSGDKTNTWKGFFIKNAEVTLPTKLKTFDNENPKFNISNLIIDRNGINGKLLGVNLIQHPKGEFGGWGGSIDTLSVVMVNSDVSDAKMKGRMHIPITDTVFYYTGLITRTTDKKDLKYQLILDTQKGLEIPLSFMYAKMKIEPTSVIKLEYDRDGFYSEANLDGIISITKWGDLLSKVDMDSLKFEGLKVRNIQPYFEEGNWNFTSPQKKIAGFPLNINDISLVSRTSSDGRIGPGLQFNIDLQLQPGSNSIGGSTKLTLWSKVITGEGRQRIVFDGVQLDSIGINADIGAVKMRGGLSLFQSDATYGDGFRGSVSATFVDKISVSSTAQFGSVNNFKYWYVDAKAIMPAGVPVFTNFGLYGFGGGAWYKMRREGTTNLNEQASAPDSSANPSKTNSGFRYIPDNSASLGLKASVVMGTHPSPETFNGDLELQAQFQSGGGLSTISLVGQGYMLCGITERNKAKITANADVTYNIPQQTLHGLFDANISYEPAIKGGGRMVMHFAPDLWYIKLGEPSNRINLTYANLLSTQSYLMVGQQLPAPPPLPAEIQQAFPGYAASRRPEIESGNGIALGATTGFNTGPQQYMIFYGNVSAQAGYDIAMLKYPGVTCQGSNSTLGINGWYASGQIYAYLNASIGMDVDVWFTSGRYEILKLNAAAMLEGGMPNPTWIKGAIGGNYSILGGAVKGYCNYRFSIGEQCQMVTDNPLSRIDLISDISPVTGQTGVDVTTEPQVATNFKLNEPFQVNEATPNGQSRVRTFRVKIDNLKLIKVSTNQDISGGTTIASDGYSAFFRPSEALESQTRYRFVASVYGEELINNQWRPATRNNGQVIKQEVSTEFTSGVRPDKIRESDVAFSYPVNHQRFFLQNECRTGRLNLTSRLDYLFESRQGFDVQFIARFIPGDAPLSPIDVPFIYNRGTLSFEIPTLANEKSYTLQFIRRETPTDPQLARMLELMAQGVPSVNHTLPQEKNLFTKDGSTVNLMRRTVSPTSTLSWNEHLLYSLGFSTSRYNTLAQKLADFNHVTTTVQATGNFEKLIATYQGTEHFDYIDFQPITWVSSGAVHRFGPLVSIDASRRTSAWHNQFANPQVYNEISWMRSRQLWNGPVLFDDYAANPSLSYVEVNFNPPGSSLMNFATGTTFPGGAGATSQAQGTVPAGIGGGMASTSQAPNLNVLQAGSTGSPYLKITYKHGLIVPADFESIKINAIRALSNPFINLTNSDRSRLNAIRSRQYQLMFRGSYPMIFNYTGCGGQQGNISKPFVY